MRCLPWLLLAGCATTRAVAPLPAHTGAVTASLGGPILQFGSAPVPLPLVAVGYQYGLTDRTSVHADLHATGLLLLGVFGADLGVDIELLPPSGARPRLMYDQTVDLFGGNAASGPPAGGFRTFLDFGLVASWDLGPRQHHPYVGLRVFDQPFPDKYTYPYPIAGVVLNTARVGWQVELGWPGIATPNVPSFVDWVGPLHQGTLSLQLGASLALGRREKP